MAVTTKTKKKVAGAAQPDMLPFELQLIALEDVKESPRNAKQHTPAQVGDIIKSIKEFGFRDPIAVDENYEIVEGHGRVKALTQMGIAKVPALVFKDMTSDQIRAYRITHNQLTLSTGFDLGMLALELRDIETSGMDLNLTGFTLGDLESFELQMETKGTSGTQEDGAGASGASEKDSEGTGSAKESESASTASDAQVNYQYVMIFDSKEQQQRWTAFLKHLKAETEGETHAERVDAYLQAQGF